VPNKNTYFIFAILWTFIVTVLSLISISSDVGSSINVENKDKYVHFTFYFVLVVLWFLYAKSKKISQRTKLIVLLSAIGYGALMEICQAVFTTTRTADILDVIANSAGAITGLLFMIALNNKKAIH
jgi:VanZ family protein